MSEFMLAKAEQLFTSLLLLNVLTDGFVPARRWTSPESVPCCRLCCQGHPQHAEQSQRAREATSLCGETSHGSFKVSFATRCSFPPRAPQASASGAGATGGPWEGNGGSQVCSSFLYGLFLFPLVFIFLSLKHLQTLIPE